MKEESPENNLGSYLTTKKIANIVIYSGTNISTVQLSKLRNGKIKGVSAENLYLITLVVEEDISIALKYIYPNLRLVQENKQNSIEQTTNELTKLGNYLESIEKNNLQIISSKTGIKITRLKDLKKKSNSIPLAHELCLIEMAIGKPRGEIFKELYGDLKLNSNEKAAELRLKERKKTSYKK